MIPTVARTTPTTLTAALLLAIVGSTTPAGAASAEDRASASQHLKQAGELRKQGQLAEACEHLQEAENLDPKLPTLMDLADCTEQVGKLVEAQVLWAEARDRAKQTEKPQSRARAEERLAAIETRIAHLTLHLDATASGAEVLRDQTRVDPASLDSAQPLNPGDHLVVVKLAGHEDAQYDLKLNEGESRTLPLVAGPAIQQAAPPPPPPPVAPPPKPVEVSTSSGSGQRTVGLLLGAAGLVSGGIGAPLWFIGYRDSGGLTPAADQQLLAGQILVIGGGTLLLTGAVLFATAPSGAPPARARLPVAPTVALGPRAAVLGATGQF
jgi:hypothetical protein